jgi:hypothetical protein
LEQADAHGTFMGRRFAAFSLREKVSEGRMRGKRPWQIQVHRFAAILHLRSSILGFYLCPSVFICG